MQLPIVAPAPVVTAHADLLRELFENRCPCRHFQPSRTGLMVLDNTSRTNLSRCVWERADKTNLSRFFSEAPWFQDRVNARRLTYLRQQTQAVRGPTADALLLLADTWCAHVGSLFDSVERPDNHGETPYPRAPNPVTRHDVRGPVRFPVALRLERRYAERTPWEAFVHQPGPARPIPTTQQERARLQKDVEPILLADGALQKLQQQVRTKLDRGMAWLEAAIHQNVPFRGLVFDSWSLAEALGSMARYRPKDWSSLLTKNRHLDPHSFVLQEAAGPRIPLVGPHMAVEALGPLMPRTASRAVTVQDKTSWPFTLAVRLPGLGKVRLVVSCKRAALTGP